MRPIWLLALFLTLLSAGCANTSSTSQTRQQPPPSSGNGTVSVTVTPSTATIRSGDSYTFSASVNGNANTSVTWTVNAIAGGNSVLGTVNSSGSYTSPAAVPNPNLVTLTAT